MSNEIYFSVDIETGGPIPGPYSMFSLGCAVFDPDSETPEVPIKTFSINFQDLPDSTIHPNTQLFWDDNKEAFLVSRANQVPHDQAIKSFVKFVERIKKETGKSPVFVGYPATFDFSFVYWYMIKFTGYSPFSFSALDIKTYSMAKLGTEFKKTIKRNMPKEWFLKNNKHNHVALDDAIEQGITFMRILKC